MNISEQLLALDHQFRPYEPMLMLLAPALRATVPLYMSPLERRGGILDTDIARVRSYLESLTVHGNDLYYRSRKWGETAERFDQVAEIIAVLSFSSGGITVFGVHFEAHPLPSRSQNIPDDEHPGEEE